MPTLQSAIVWRVLLIVDGARASFVRACEDDTAEAYDRAALLLEVARAELLAVVGAQPRYAFLIGALDDERRIALTRADDRRKLRGGL